MVWRFHRLAKHATQSSQRNGLLECKSLEFSKTCRMAIQLRRPQQPLTNRNGDGWSVTARHCLLCTYHSLHLDQQHSKSFGLYHFEKLSNSCSEHDPIRYPCIWTMVQFLKLSSVMHSTCCALRIFGIKVRMYSTIQLFNYFSKLTSRWNNTPSCHSEICIWVLITQVSLQTCGPKKFAKVNWFHEFKEGYIISLLT